MAESAKWYNFPKMEKCVFFLLQTVRTVSAQVVHVSEKQTLGHEKSKLYTTSMVGQLLQNKCKHPPSKSAQKHL